MKIIDAPIDKYFHLNIPESVVLHVDLGTEEGTLATLRGTKSVSYHFYVPKRPGVVYQFVDIHNGAWHAGQTYNPTKEARYFYKGANANKHSVGICYEGRAVDKNGNIAVDESKAVNGQLATKSQVERIAAIMEAYDLDKRPLFAHQEITSYKPRVVLTVKDKVVKQLDIKNKSIKKIVKKPTKLPIKAMRPHKKRTKELKYYTTKELIAELLRRFNS